MARTQDVAETTWRKHVKHPRAMRNAGSLACLNPRLCWCNARAGAVTRAHASRRRACGNACGRRAAPFFSGWTCRDANADGRAAGAE
ncbi:hypothetical protein VFPFJ_00406 [Purpureocillium lilacinum]|uniref:Uncharacterized protein n=1 Tax=Purpureocillium lilacinum TaxID=33203 RepID=A0A179HV88_PURLI|nr:hypothetical protein VFPFJ_00406 [Purpureocillium lilacinum]OAQ94297.1 hypothetical protein VFPFJ_00406 [Purpureocillium lilacinum]